MAATSRRDPGTRRSSPSARAAAFDRLYAGATDPWSYRGSPYERSKYAATVAALPRRQYRAGLEVGCSIGELSARLAGRCRRLVGIDASAVAIGTAQAAHGGRPGLEFRAGELPGAWPDGHHDLIVLSEVLYYLTLSELSGLAARMDGSWTRGGHCVLVNWMGATGTPLSGAAAAARFRTAFRRRVRCRTLRAVTTTRYRLELLERGHRS